MTCKTLCDFCRNSLIYCGTRIGTLIT